MPTQYFIENHMAVNLQTPKLAALHPVVGVKLGHAEASIRTPGRKDLLVMTVVEGSCVSGVFTQNHFCAAPVTLCKKHLAAKNGVRALLINTGNANAGTGELGMQHAMQSCESLAVHLQIKPSQILTFSTGVILEPLPIEKMIAGMPTAIKHLKPNNWLNAAEAIMTTDTVPKSISRQVHIGGELVTITGMSKGSGMIHPNMATMLGFIATDAVITQAALDAIIQYAVDQSFNCITVDGDTSTNDSFIMIATNQADNKAVTENSADFIVLRDAMTEVAISLAHAIVRDGEGATKFITIQVESGRNEVECRKVADAIAHSPLVKTAFFASDPNLGRILAAIGYAEVDDLNVNALSLYLGDVLVIENGGVAASYQELHGQKIMSALRFLCE